MYFAECTDVIMEDAKSFKEHWMERLQQLELEALLSKRDALMAQGALYNMVASDSSRNQDFLKREVRLKHKMCVCSGTSNSCT